MTNSNYSFVVTIEYKLRLSDSPEAEAWRIAQADREKERIAAKEKAEKEKAERKAAREAEQAEKRIEKSITYIGEYRTIGSWLQFAADHIGGQTLCGLKRTMNSRPKVWRLKRKLTMA